MAKKGGLVLKGPGLARLQNLGLKLKNAKRMQLVVAKAQAEEAIDLVKLGFRAESDPYGDKWAKRKKPGDPSESTGDARKAPKARSKMKPRTESKATKRKRLKRASGKKVLTKSGRMKQSFKRTMVSATGWRISSSVDYSPHHQDPKRGPGGKLKRPRRMMVPDEKLGLPRAWRKGLGEATGDAIRHYISTQK